MQKIYSSARTIIYSLMADLNANHDFSHRETIWKATTVEDEFVILEIHERIKDILEKELEENKDLNGKITFNRKSAENWEAHICAAGAESYFFARMLLAAVTRVKKGKGSVNIESVDLEMINRCTKIALPKTEHVDAGLVIKSEKNNGLYKMTIPVEGINWTFSNTNVDILCKGIGLQLRGRIK